MQRTNTRRQAPLILAFAALSAALMAQGTPIGFEETYALSTDRSKAIATLIPGTEDWYYYSCRERLDARDFAAIRTLLATWIDRHGRSSRVLEIENREALLSFGQNGERTFDFLRQRLDLSWNHQRVLPGARSELPTRLDPALLSPATLTAAALARDTDTVDGFAERALPALASTNLRESQLRSLLTRLDRPDIANLPALIVRDLATRSSQGFGSLPIHNELRREQLDECARLRPQLLQDGRFVNAYLVRLQPSPDGSWPRDAAARTAQLARLWEFAQRLTPAFNSLKAHVLFHWLAHDLTQGQADKQRFLSYIRLPRRSGIASERLRQHARGDEFVDGNLGFPTLLPPIADDTSLVRTCLEQFFAREDSIDAYSEYLDARWLTSVLAETKILLGDGDMERWHSLLADPQQLAQIDKRVEITFPKTQRTLYGSGDAVTLEVDTKNVPTLLLKVFAIDSYRYHTEMQREVSATIALDGVVANSEQTFTYSEPPRRRVRRTFELPMLREPGTYVVELVGNGISSRAVVHKGNLRYVERTSAGGQLFRVYDEAGLQQNGASLWLGGREYTADEGGEILVPFSTDPGQKKVVLRQGNRSTLAVFTHRAESYSLRGNAHVDREALVAGQKARLVLRPQLRLAERDVSVKLLQEPVLVITATDLDGVHMPQEVRDLALTDGRELVHEFTVPERLRSLQVTLRGKLKDLAGKDVELASDAVAFEVNGVDATPATGSAMLVQTADGYALEVRGKNGEPRGGQMLTLQFKHRDYRTEVTTPLQTDANGRIELGPLSDIESLAFDQAGARVGLALHSAHCRLPTVLHGRVGDTLRLPYQGKATTASRAEFSLLGHEHDEFSHLALANGFLELRDLAAGDYRLRLHEAGVEIPVRMTQGARDGEWLIGSTLMLEASPNKPLHLRSVETADGELVVRLANATPGTRVHIAATRFQPAFELLPDLQGAPAPLPLAFGADRAESSYQSGRNLGDEYRYVLERRFQTRFAGNMLHRPSQLLNPWSIDDNSKNEALGLGGKKGGAYKGPSDRMPGDARPDGSVSYRRGSAFVEPGTIANLDYLPRGATTLHNLTPDQNGIVRVKLAELGEGQLVHVLALDGDQALYDTVVRQEQPLRPRARQLRNALDGTQHFTEQQRIQFVAGGGTAVLGDAAATELEIFDSLAGVYRVMTAISKDPALLQFAFVLRWPQFTPAEKRQLYSQYACHELHFFLHQKDPAFFAAVVKPFLANKVDKTFLDHWLLGLDLTGYLEPWAFAQCNLIEKILLAQRLSGEQRSAVARLVREQLELRPIARERLEELFRLALHSRALDETVADGAVEQLRAGLVLGKNVPATQAPAEKAPVRDRAGLDLDALESRREVAREQAKDKDAKKLAEVDKESAFDSNQWNSAVGLGQDLERRGKARHLFRAVEPSKLLVEHNYWQRRIENTTPDVVAPNHFWVDYATAPAGQPFVSSAIAEASGSFLEMMFALSVLDLPFEAGKHEITADGDKRTLRAATPLLLVRKEVTNTEKATDLPPLLLGENFFRLDDRYRFENGERRDAFVGAGDGDEFLVGVAYGCQVVITNPTSSKRTIEVLLQVPAGAIPVQKGFWTKGRAVELEPYGTQTIEYAFYFPAANSFAHYPAHAAEKGKLAANAEARTLKVVTELSKVDTTSWEHVSQQGTAAEVIGYLDASNIQRLDLSRVAWRMKDREFFSTLLTKLRTRHVYDDTLWSYGILHRDASATREYLQHADSFLQACGAWLESTLVTIDPVERRQFQLVELDPLVHARAHRMGSQRVIGNADLARQYGSLMNLLGYRPQLDSEDWMTVTYYLLLQDRVEDALASFARIDAAKVAAKVQYDYLQAYLCFFTGDVQKARSTASRYATYAVPHWQKRFSDVIAQLDEAEGKRPATGDEATPDSLAATAPAIELAGEGSTVQLAYRNLEQCEVRYYELDVEFAFSAQPFADPNGTSAAFVQPNLREVKQLEKAQTQLTFALPAQFQQKNVLVEVRAAGLVRSRQFFANALHVRFLESYGQVAVSEPTGDKPLPKTYVKVFAKLQNGQVRFHKDGYTDLRGRFDYASLSNDPNAGAECYAVLVLSEQRGAVIREMNPPTR
ncbi:MAG: hypothetical protein ABIP94_01455 [Planctomycetota bacterium]